LTKSFSIDKKQVEDTCGGLSWDGLVVLCSVREGTITGPAKAPSERGKTNVGMNKRFRAWKSRKRKTFKQDKTIILELLNKVNIFSSSSRTVRGILSLVL